MGYALKKPIDLPPATEHLTTSGLLQELEGLSRYIAKVQDDLLAVGSATLKTSHIPHAADQLGAVVEATESAANQIMDACDVLETVASGLDAEPASQIRGAVTTIYEACGFQDLTGQRIGNVATTLTFIEGKITDLMSSLGIEAGEITEHAVAAEEQVPEEKQLLNGPQLPDQAIDQSQIDQLMTDLFGDGAKR